MKTLTFFAAATLSVNFLSAQDPGFTNQYQTLLFNNPAYAGSNGLVRSQLAYRNQYPNLSGNFQTIAGATDVYVNALRAGLGATYLHDSQWNGLLKHSSYGFVYAQHISCKNSDLKIVPAIHLAYSEKSLDVMSMHFGGIMNPRAGVQWNNPTAMPNTRVSYFDLGSGLLVNYRSRLNAGVSFLHLNRPDEGLLEEYGTPVRTTIHGSYNWTFAERHLLQLGYRYVRQGFYQGQMLTINAVLWSHVMVAVGASNANAGIIQLGYRHDYFILQAGYDAVISAQSLRNSGSWEFGASFNLREKENRKKLVNLEQM